MQSTTNQQPFEELSAERVKREYGEQSEGAIEPAAIQNWDAFNQRDLPMGEKIIHELERGELGLIASVTNVGKSTLLRNLAMSITCGRAFLPLLKESAKPRRVVLLDFETRPSRLQRDLRKMEVGLTTNEVALVRKNLGLVCDSHLNGEPLCLSEKSHQKWLADNLKTFKADFAIVDTVAAAFAVFDENSNAEINRRVLKPMASIAVETKVALLLSHHIGKQQGDESSRSGERAYRSRGASSFGAFASLVLNLTQDPNDANRRVLSLAKAKGEQFADTVLSLDCEKRWFSVSSVTATSIPTSYDLVMNLFAKEKTFRTHEAQAALAGTVAGRTVRDCLKRGLINGFLECPKRGMYSVRQVRQGTIGIA